MGQTGKLTELEQRIDRQFGLSRGILLLIGVACLLLGGLSVALPLSLYGSLVLLVGVVLLVLGRR